MNIFGEDILAPNNHNLWWFRSAVRGLHEHDLQTNSGTSITQRNAINGTNAQKIVTSHFQTKSRTTFTNVPNAPTNAINDPAAQKKFPTHFQAYMRKTRDAGDISPPIFWIFRQI